MPSTRKKSNNGSRIQNSPIYGFGSNVSVRRLSSKSAPGSRNAYMGFGSTKQQVVPGSTKTYPGFGSTQSQVGFGDASLGFYTTRSKYIRA